MIFSHIILRFLCYQKALIMDVNKISNWKNLQGLIHREPSWPSDLEIGYWLSKLKLHNSYQSKIWWFQYLATERYCGALVGKNLRIVRTEENNLLSQQIRSKLDRIRYSRSHNSFLWMARKHFSLHRVFTKLRVDWTWFIKIPFDKTTFVSCM